MAKQAIGLGTTADDGSGDTLRAGGTKINENFDELYDLMGDGTDLSSGISATASVVTLTAPSIGGVVAGTQTSATITTLTSSTISSGSTITLDAETDITLDAKGGDIYLKDDGTIFGTLTNSGGNLTIKNSSSEVAAIQIAGDEVITFADDLLIKDAGTIGNASVADIMTLAATGIVTFKDDVVIKDGGTIGSGTTPAAITISSAGLATFSSSVVVNGTITGTSVKDEDNMASDSATHLASQQSIKAYVDANAGAGVGLVIALGG